MEFCAPFFPPVGHQHPTENQSLAQVLGREEELGCGQKGQSGCSGGPSVPYPGVCSGRHTADQTRSSPRPAGCWGRRSGARRGGCSGPGCSAGHRWWCPQSQHFSSCTQTPATHSTAQAVNITQTASLAGHTAGLGLDSFCLCCFYPRLWQRPHPFPHYCSVFPNSPDSNSEFPFQI